MKQTPLFHGLNHLFLCDSAVHPVRLNFGPRLRSFTHRFSFVLPPFSIYLLCVLDNKKIAFIPKHSIYPFIYHCLLFHLLAGNDVLRAVHGQKQQNHLFSFIIFQQYLFSFLDQLMIIDKYHQTTSLQLDTNAHPIHPTSIH